MKKIRISVIVILSLLVLQSCDAPQDQEWYSRDSELKYYEEKSLHGTSSAAATITKNFEESQTADGKKKYLFKTNDSSYLNIATVSKLTDTSKPYPTTISASASRQSGSSTAGFGILFAAQKPNGKLTFLSIQINTSGQYLISKWSGNSCTIIQNWTSSAYIKKGYGVQNTIKVELESSTNQASTFKVYFNNIYTCNFQDTIQPVLSTGAHGYIVSIPDNENLPQGFVEVTFIE